MEDISEKLVKGGEEMEPVKGGEEISSTLKILSDRYHEGVVFVDDKYRIVYINHILGIEFTKKDHPEKVSEIIGKSYFDFFFGSVTSKKKSTYPVFQVFKGSITDPVTDEKLAENNVYYEITAYPLVSQSPAKLVMEIWSRLGSKEFVELCRAYSGGKK